MQSRAPRQFKRCECAHAAPSRWPRTVEKVTNVNKCRRHEYTHRAAGRSERVNRQRASAGQTMRAFLPIHTNRLALKWDILRRLATMDARSMGQTNIVFKHPPLIVNGETLENTSGVPESEWKWWHNFECMNQAPSDGQAVHDSKESDHCDKPGGRVHGNNNSNAFPHPTWSPECNDWSLVWLVGTGKWRPIVQSLGKHWLADHYLRIVETNSRLGDHKLSQHWIVHENEPCKPVFMQSSTGKYDSPTRMNAHFEWRIQDKFLDSLVRLRGDRSSEQSSEWCGQVSGTIDRDGQSRMLVGKRSQLQLLEWSRANKAERTKPRTRTTSKGPELVQVQQVQGMHNEERVQSRKASTQLFNHRCHNKGKGRAFKSLSH